MTSRPAPWQSYKTVSTTTAPPEQLVLMLYDGAIGYLERSLAGFDFTDPLEFNQTINNNVQRAQAIIYEMNGRLDMERGGEIALNFRRLYDYFYRRLQQGNFTKNKSPIIEVLNHLRGIRESWAQMLRRGPDPEGTEADVSMDPELRVA